MLDLTVEVYENHLGPKLFYFVVVVVQLGREPYFGPHFKQARLPRIQHIMKLVDSLAHTNHDLLCCYETFSLKFNKLTHNSFILSATNEYSLLVMIFSFALCAAFLHISLATTGKTIPFCFSLSPI